MAMDLISSKSFHFKEFVLLMEHLSCGPVTATQIKIMTRRDKDLPRVLYYVQNGWPVTVDPPLRPYASRNMNYLP